MISQIARNLARFIAVVLFLFSFSSQAEVIDSEEAVAFASFIKEMIHGSQFPSNHNSVCTIGKDEISKILAREKKYIDLNTDSDQYKTCNAIYVAVGNKKTVWADVLKFNKAKVLTIGIFEGFAESGGIVQIQMGRRNFELTLNQKMFKESGVRLSPLATSLVVN